MELKTPIIPWNEFLGALENNDRLKRNFGCAAGNSAIAARFWRIAAAAARSFPCCVGCLRWRESHSRVQPPQNPMSQPDSADKRPYHAEYRRNHRLAGALDPSHGEPRELKQMLA